MTDRAPRPIDIHLHRKSRELEMVYSEDERYRLPCEYLRVYSPSAEVKGHGPGQEILQTGKMHVAITDIRPVGHYALQLVFDDGHDTGLYSWDYLHDLCSRREALWQGYLDRMSAAGATRDPQVQVIQFQP